MKKLLLGTSALIAGGLVASGAAAAEWSATVGGAATLGIGYVDADDIFGAEGEVEFIEDEDGDVTLEEDNTESGDVGEIEIVNDGEVTFNFNLTADNGLEFYYRVELQNESGDTDEYVGGVKGAFGELYIGAEDGAHDKNKTGIVGCGYSCAGDGGGLLFDEADLNSIDVVIHNFDGSVTERETTLSVGPQASNSSDAIKIGYVTPSFSGFSAAISYTPDNGSEDGTSTNLLQDDDVFELGASYSGSFDMVSIDAGVGWSSFFGDDQSDADGVTLGLVIGYGGFAVGGQYGFTNVDGGDDTAGFTVGAEYSTGPHYVGVNYGQTTDGPDEDDWGLSADYNYDLAPGVNVGVSIEYAEEDVSDESLWAAGLWMGLDY